MKASIYDVAKKAGVSVVTVSRVINNAPTVRDSSRSKVMKAIEELNYQPNAAARSLARGRTNVIGMLVPDVNDPFLMAVVKAADAELEKRGYFLALGVERHNDTGGKPHSSPLFQQDRVEAVIILTPLYEADYIEELSKKNIPFVIMDNQSYPFTVPSVVVDNFKGGYEVGKHFVDTGHKKIAHVGGPCELLSANDRCAGFTKALEEIGMTPFEVIRGNFEISSGQEAVQKWAKAGQYPDGVFAGDDHTAFGVIDALRMQGLTVPDDVSVIGYDDHPFCAELNPHLTTVKQPAEEIAAKGVDLMIRILKGDARKNAVIKLEPEMIIRNSVKNRL